MATGCSFLSEDQFMCSICLDIFTEPVSIPCGHNFCKACITRHWEGRQQCQCPLCNEKFNKGLKLRVNTGFREVVENFKERHAPAEQNSLVKPGQVLCDCCLSNKFKASKTCLVCLTSFCETHLEPHRRVAALRRHKLIDPVHNLEDQICKKHNRMLERFCKNDQTCVCALCTEHSAHDTVPLEEACVDRRAQKGKKKAQVQEMNHKRGKRAQKTKVAAQTKKKGKDEAMANSEVSNEVQAPRIWWIPHPPNRYDHAPGDLSKGGCYYEVEAEEDWDVGVARGLMQGTRIFIPRNKNWVIRLGSHANCQALQNAPVHFFWINKLESVIVFVDYDKGSVSFVDINTMILLHNFIGCKFNEMTYMFYSPGPPQDDSWEQRLRKRVQRMKEWSQLPDTIFCFRCIAFVFFFVLVICIFLKEQYVISPPGDR